MGAEEPSRSENGRRPELAHPDGAAQHSSAEEPFAAPEGTEWNRVSERFVWYRRLVLLGGVIPASAVGAPLLGVLLGPGTAVAWIAAMAVLAGLGWYTAVPATRTRGYAEGRTDLYLRYGLLVRRLVVVPYGRMQLVDVTSNVVEQGLDLATVRVHTAAATIEAYVAGLPAEEANRLRDRLTVRSETFSTGL